MAQDSDDTNLSCSAGDPSDVARSIIDRDIARLEERIRVLKSRRNELSPISCLPAEILCKIFSLIEDKSTSYLGRDPGSWTNFSRVSQHWRSLTLNAPELWTNISLGYPRWAKEMLIRSKKAKLTIRVRSDLSYLTSNPKYMETIRSCLQEMNRVEEIEMTTDSKLLDETFRDMPKSAPQLHTLCIKSHSAHYASGATFPIHEDFLCDTERLRHVVLFNCKISWDSPFLTGLTHLTLEDSLKPNSSITQVLHALQRMPALTELHLKQSLPDDSESLSTYPDVDLPCLRVLLISSGVDALTTVLRHISFPHSAVLNLTCKEKQSNEIDFSNFLSALATKFLSSLVIRSLSLKGLDDIVTQGLEFNLWTTTIIQDHSPSSINSTKSQLQLTLTWPSSHRRHHVKALTCASDAMSLSFLTQLQISTMDYIDSNTWVKTFGKLPVLQRVCVRSYAAHSFFEALVYKRKEAGKSKTAYLNVSFPKLRYISVEGHVFSDEFSDSLSGSISINMLFDYLMERCERNAGIQALRLGDCYHISWDDVERLEEIVVDVTWDGVEQAVSTHYDSEDEREYDSDGNTLDGMDYDEYDGHYGSFFTRW